MMLTALKTAAAAATFALLAGTAGAATFPIANGPAGTPIYVATTGEVTAIFQGVSPGTAYVNDLYFMLNGQPDRFLFNSRQTPVGTTVSLGNFTAGTELIFRLYVQNTQNSFYTGDATRNSDGHAHAVTQGEWKPGETLVSFEDLKNGPFDFNDTSFSFTNTSDQQPAPVPVPAAAVLLLTGLGSVAAFRRKSA